MAQTWRMDRSLRRRKPPPPPLTEAALRERALTYVARYATTSHKLAQYLRRKLVERGWAGDAAPPIEALVEECVAARWIDDEAYATARVRSMARAGYGERRRAEKLRIDGLDVDQRRQAEEAAEEDGDAGLAWTSALAFARRRRLGPFATATPDEAQRRKHIAAFLRAGHSYELARKIVALKPGDELINEA